MAEIVLDQTKVLPAVGEIEAARVPQHMRMQVGQSGSLASFPYQVIHRLACQRLPAFRDKEPRRAAVTFRKIPLDGAQLVAVDRMLDR